MKRVLRWTTLRLNRRTMLRGASGTAFGVLAGAAVGRPALAARIAAAAPCTGPGGTGACPSGVCSGGPCHNTVGGIFCRLVSGFCVGTSPCWTSTAGGTCCDCRCRKEGTQAPEPDGGGPVPTRSFYCYCHN